MIIYPKFYRHEVKLIQNYLILKIGHTNFQQQKLSLN